MQDMTPPSWARRLGFVDPEEGINPVGALGVVDPVPAGDAVNALRDSPAAALPVMPEAVNQPQVMEGPAGVLRCPAPGTLVQRPAD